MDGRLEYNWFNIWEQRPWGFSYLLRPKHATTLKGSSSLQGAPRSNDAGRRPGCFCTIQGASPCRPRSETPRNRHSLGLSSGFPAPGRESEKQLPAPTPGIKAAYQTDSTKGPPGPTCFQQGFPLRTRYFPPSTNNNKKPYSR